MKIRLSQNPDPHHGPVRYISRVGAGGKDTEDTLARWRGGWEVNILKEYAEYGLKARTQFNNPPPPTAVIKYILYIYLGKGGIGGKVEGQQYTSIVS
jgi:hypothetical protein